MREHIVQLARDPAALGDSRRARLLIARVLKLGEQQLRLVLALPRPLQNCATTPNNTVTSIAAATAEDELPAAAVTAPSPTVTTPPTATPALNGSRVIAMNTATPAATPVAPFS